MGANSRRYQWAGPGLPPPQQQRMARSQAQCHWSCGSEGAAWMAAFYLSTELLAAAPAGPGGGAGSDASAMMRELAAATALEP
jgi:hypothetical protein